MFAYQVLTSVVMLERVGGSECKSGVRYTSNTPKWHYIEWIHSSFTAHLAKILAMTGIVMLHVVAALHIFISSVQFAPIGLAQEGYELTSEDNRSLTVSMVSMASPITAPQIENSSHKLTASVAQQNATPRFTAKHYSQIKNSSTSFISTEAKPKVDAVDGEKNGSVAENTVDLPSSVQPVAKNGGQPGKSHTWTKAHYDADYLNNPLPRYPLFSKRLREQGHVLLKVKVSPSGFAVNVKISKSSGHHRLDNAARQAVKNWRFVPSMHGKTAVYSWVFVPVEFNLRSKA